MRYFVTPTFSEKVTSAGAEVLASAANAMSRIEGATKDELAGAAALLETNPIIYALRDRNFRVLFTFGSDDEGDYALLLDLIVHGSADTPRAFPKHDPKLNMMVDPKRNMMIDPTRNMMIDPNRNMMIDPRRNMMIDPRRNMMIDPQRNMMIDVRRNMMIDPARNMGIDPKRNWQINPRQNSAWDGPLLYSLSGELAGFLVRANEKVALLFKPSGEFASSVVKAGEKNFNCFGREGNWTGFLVHNGADGYNQFDVDGRWIGFLVGEPQLVDAA